MSGAPHLTRHVSRGVTLLSDVRRPGGVTLAFTERTGGVSSGPYASLNLGDACGDDAGAVSANRVRLADALGIGHLSGRLVNPRQVHGDHVVTITSGAPAAVAAAQREAREGADAVVCAAADVPVLLCFADCVPVVMVAPGAFAVVHSGWRGTMARICAKALDALTASAGCVAGEVLCYVGPHISGADYEVPEDRARRFSAAFGDGAAPGGDHVDLGFAVRLTLEACGVRTDAIEDDCPSTTSCTQRFFSYRGEGGTTGRHGAVAVRTEAGGGTR